MGEPVVIASAALRCFLGETPEAAADALLAGGAPAQRLELPHFGGRDYLYYPNSDAAALQQPGRQAALLQGCVSEALAGAALSPQLLEETALFLGSSSFAIGEEELRMEAELAAGRDCSLFPHTVCGDMADELARRFALRGGVYSFNTACTASANALLYAQQMVGSGRIPAALVVGVECFNYTTLFGFDSLQLLSRDGYRPFDRERSGLVLGEGIAAVVVTSAQQLGVATQWGDMVIAGGDNGCDPNGMTCSSAQSMAQVMSGALRHAGLRHGDIELIKAHATGSESNDAAEAAAMRQEFAGGLPDFTALKGGLGHTLGASGVLEVVALAACLRRGTVPCSRGFAQPDEALGVAPLKHNRPYLGGAVMCNYFGFGGNNTSLILRPAS